MGSAFITPVRIISTRLEDLLQRLPRLATLVPQLDHFLTHSAPGPGAPGMKDPPQPVVNSALTQTDFASFGLWHSILHIWDHAIIHPTGRAMFRCRWWSRWQKCWWCFNARTCGRTGRWARRRQIVLDLDRNQLDGGAGTVAIVVALCWAAEVLRTVARLEIREPKVLQT